MLVFNCTKAAVDFFTVIKKGVKVTNVEPAPHKTIAQSLEVWHEEETGTQPWHWIVHVVKRNRKNVLVVMDYHSRFALTFTEFKKGQAKAFVDLFLIHVRTHAAQMMTKTASKPQLVEDSFARYSEQHRDCIFHPRSDRSVQSHINDVVWAYELWVERAGYVLNGVELIEFADNVNGTPRKRKTDKDYIFPYKVFLHYWLTQFATQSDIQADERVEALRALRSAEFHARVGL
ncbi:MAG: hypothetical protein MJK04_10385 [Psychrosphaera sp.]|nr:hypothetical protein [Psychrosphaera sp.]